MENRIRELRKARHMTMKQLGAVFGIAESTISQYETGKRQPDNETLLKLGEFFNVSVDYLLGRENKSPPSTSTRSASDDDIKFALFGGDGEVTDAMYEEVKRFAKMVKLREEAEKEKNENNG